jgi:hypothetical protein
MKVLALAITIVFVTLCLSRYSRAGDTPGSVMIYSNDDCTNPHNTPTPLSAGSCLETNQTAAISIVSLPPCATGEQALLYISDQENCGMPSLLPAVSSGTPGECLYLTSGRGIGSAAFVCVGGTTTTSGSNDNAVSQTPAAITTTYDSGTAPTVQPALGQGSSLPGGLSQSDRIALACAIAFGVPALVLAYLSWRKRSIIFHHGYVHGEPIDGLPPPYELHDSRQQRG